MIPSSCTRLCRVSYREKYSKTYNKKQEYVSTRIIKYFCEICKYIGR